MNEEAVIFLAALAAAGGGEIGRAACRERGEISGGAGSLKKKKARALPHRTFALQHPCTLGLRDRESQSVAQSRLRSRGRALHVCVFFFFFSSRRRHTRLVSDWSSDVCSSD